MHYLISYRNNRVEWNTGKKILEIQDEKCYKLSSFLQCIGTQDIRDRDQMYQAKNHLPELAFLASLWADQETQKKWANHQKRNYPVNNHDFTTGFPVLIRKI